MSALTTAVHESGHAAVACALGWPRLRASIVPNADSLGHVQAEFARPSPDRPRRAPTDSELVRLNLGFAMQVLAGPCAEIAFTGEADDGSWADYEHADRRVEVLATQLEFRGDERRLRDIIAAETSRFLLTHWATVEALTEALISERTLGDARVRELAGHLPHPGLRELEQHLRLWARRMGKRE